MNKKVTINMKKIINNNNNYNKMRMKTKFMNKINN